MCFGLMTAFDTARDCTITHTKYCPQSRFYRRFLVAASNGRRYPSSGFPNYPQTQLPVSHSNSSQRLNPSVYLTNSPPTNSTPLTPLADSSLTYPSRNISAQTT
jgi:hypothetical protein